MEKSEQPNTSELKLNLLKEQFNGKSVNPKELNLTFRLSPVDPITVKVVSYNEEYHTFQVQNAADNRVFEFDPMVEGSWKWDNPADLVGSFVRITGGFWYDNSRTILLIQGSDLGGEIKVVENE
jgi:hypothetical protein